MAIDQNDRFQEECRMWAAVRDRYGSTDRVDVREVSRPPIGPCDVNVRVLAAGVDQGVLRHPTGRPYVMRVAGQGLRRPRCAVMGTNLAGIVTAPGADTTRFQPGDEVFGIGRGTYAEYASADETQLAAKPKTLSFEEAAVLATSGLVALQAVRDHAEVTSGKRVLVLGASGDVGALAVQIAKDLGADVTGTCAPQDVDVAKAAGADPVLDYTPDETTIQMGRFDAIIDTVGKQPLSRLRKIMRPDGTLVITGRTDGRWLGGADRRLRALLLSGLVRQRLTAFAAQEDTADLLALKYLAERGKLRPFIDRTYPLIHTAKALRHVADGHASGRVAIAMPAQ